MSQCDDEETRVKKLVIYANHVIVIKEKKRTRGFWRGPRKEEPNSFLFTFILPAQNFRQKPHAKWPADAHTNSKNFNTNCIAYFHQKTVINSFSSGIKVVVGFPWVIQPLTCSLTLMSAKIKLFFVSYTICSTYAWCFLLLTFYYFLSEMCVVLSFTREKKLSLGFFLYP